MKRKIEILETKSKLSTLRVDDIYIYSKYDPMKNIRMFWDSNSYRYEENRSITIYGLGLGYHIIELLNRVDSEFMIYVFDIDDELYDIVKDNEFIKKIRDSKNVSLTIGYNKENMSLFSEAIKKYENLVLVDSIVKSISNENYEFKNLLKDYKMAENAIKLSCENMNHCRKENLLVDFLDIDCLIEKYKNSNKPIILVASGPSLDMDAMNSLKRYRDEIIIFSVGRSIKALVDYNIFPDMFCIIDCGDEVYEHIIGIENIKIPMAFLNTANSLAVRKYNGPKYIFYNEDLGQKYIINTGKSVATAILDISIKCLPKKIIFIGQDLAFTNNQGHSEYTRFEYDKQLSKVSYLNKVKSVDGNYLPTTEGLKCFKRWIERSIANNQNIEFFNCSRGASILGTRYVDIHDIYSIIK